MEAEKCSFCGKSSRLVQKLIAGPSVRICDECVATCVWILAEEGIELIAETGISLEGESSRQATGSSRFGGVGRIVSEHHGPVEPDHG